jgi:hypothetical protein
MKFIVCDITQDRKVGVVYLDTDANGILSPRDEVYILEPDSLGQPGLVWRLVMQGDTGNDPAPLPGDIFLFKTFKNIKSGDAFEFRGTAVSVTFPRVPVSYRLEQNFPNPFNPSTMIWFEVGRTGPANLQVFDLLGQCVGTLFDGMARADQSYQVMFDGSRLSTGVYFYRLRAGDYIQTRRLLLLK